MSLAINLGTRGRPDLLKATIETTLKNISRSDTLFMVSIDDDDKATLDALYTLPEHPAMYYSVRPREDSLGGKFNRVLAVEASVYLAMVDYGAHVTPAFDQKILDAAAIFEDDGIGVVFNQLANGSFPQINAVTRGLALKMGCFFPEDYPYWFVDHHLDDIARMIGRIAYVDLAIDCDARRHLRPGAGTHDRRDPAFWATYFDAAKVERRRIAASIINSPDFIETPGRKKLLIHDFAWIEDRSEKINDNVRASAMAWAQAAPPEPVDDRYRRIRGRALEKLRGFVAELEAEEATKAVNAPKAA